jgi:hypothetical protein
MFDTEFKSRVRDTRVQLHSTPSLTQTTDVRKDGDDDGDGDGDGMVLVCGSVFACCTLGLAHNAFLPGPLKTFSSSRAPILHFINISPLPFLHQSQLVAELAQ